MNTEEVDRLKAAPVSSFDELIKTADIVLLVTFTGDAPFILRRVMEILLTVVSAPAVRWQNEATWPTDLPSWFVDACAQEIDDDERNAYRNWWQGLDEEGRRESARDYRWTVHDWLSWFQPDDRMWFWLGARVDSANSAAIAVEVDGWPTPLGSLRWLLQSSGAESIEIIHPDGSPAD